MSIIVAGGAGLSIPTKPAPSSCSLAGCNAWEELALADSKILYIRAGSQAIEPMAGDIMLFDRVFNNKPHDHMGILIQNKAHFIQSAEGNVNNVSAVLERKKDAHIRAYIRFSENYVYK